MRKKSVLAAAGIITAMSAAAVLPSSPGGVAASAVTAHSVSKLGATARAGVLKPDSAGHVIATAFHGDTPPTTAQCETNYGIACYSPNQIEQAYDVKPLWSAGVTGRGETIVLADAFGSPTIQHDLDTFDKAFGLPNTTVEIQQPSGPVTFDPTSSDDQGWAFESTLDVEYAHALAPAAHLVLMETPVSETEGVTGLPELMNGEQSLINRGIGDVISQSFGATEDTFDSPQQILNLRYAFKDAALHGVTVTASSGDSGATDYELDGETLYSHRVNSWPSSDPLVTSVGGTQLHLDANGNRTSPDTVWNDGYGAGGGGLSTVFQKPLFQYGLKSVPGNQRATPDISMSAAVDGAAIVYISADPDPANDGFQLVGGTSEASPIFAGVVALSDQLAGHRLGDINPALYLLAKLPAARTGIVDVTSGNNSYNGVTGFTAGTGYDIASGNGTVDAAQFAKALSRLYW